MESSLENKFNEIYTSYSKTIFSVIYPYMKSQSESEDILQEAFISYLENKPNLEGDKLKYWLIRVAINKCINALKEKSRKNVELLENYNYSFEENTSNNYVLEAIKSLPVEYKSVIILFYYQDFSIKEISKILKISTGLVGNRLSKARQLLKVELEDK